MVKSISILGSTGSVGSQTVGVAEKLNIRIAALAANRKTDVLETQVRKFHPDVVSVTDEKAAKDMKIRIADTATRVISGEDGLSEVACYEGSECVVTAVSGSIGLRPTLAAIEAKKRIALANKETLVCAGELVMKRASECGAEIVPVDSEHMAVFQCLQGRKKSELKRILLTGSGGPFRGKKRSELENITPEQAVRHPNWNMGAKISVDSSTLMNKGLEFIEAMHLFGVSPDNIQVVIHPQSTVHSMLELIDGTVIAQLGVTDMGLPIHVALTYPERTYSSYGSLDFWAMKDMTFEKPDFENMPCLALAMECARKGGTAPCVMSAANEVAVGKFLRHEMGYNRIYDACAAAVENIPSADADNLDVILRTDAEAREFVVRNF